MTPPYLLPLFPFLWLLCSHTSIRAAADSPELFVVVLGVAQDGGYPQAGCRRDCCREAWENTRLRRSVSCIALVDRLAGQRFLFDCTPDFPEQMQRLESIAARSSGKWLDGIFLTHAHIGHYTGLMYLGREVVGADGVPVYGTNRMCRFLSRNGPWDQLIQLKHIRLNPVVPDQPIQLNERLSVTAFTVPHRDEYSDTVGFKISSPGKTLVYLPDIDKWSRWDRSIEQLIEHVDFALLDGTFFADGELPGRDMTAIPHPFVQESIARFSVLDQSLRNRIRFIHLNHSNPAIRQGSDPHVNAAVREIQKAGMGVAVEGEVISLD